MNTSGGYTMQVGNSQFSGRSLAQGTSSISKLQVFNIGAGTGPQSDVFFNTLTISAVPEASPWLRYHAQQRLSA